MGGGFEPIYRIRASYRARVKLTYKSQRQTPLPFLAGVLWKSRQSALVNAICVPLFGWTKIFSPQTCAMSITNRFDQHKETCKRIWNPPFFVSQALTFSITLRINSFFSSSARPADPWSISVVTIFRVKSTLPRKNRGLRCIIRDKNRKQEQESKAKFWPRWRKLLIGVISIPYNTNPRLIIDSYFHAVPASQRYVCLKRLSQSG